VTTPCGCGSGLPRREVLDGHGIFLFFCCDRCYAGKRARYRADIFERYETDEPIEPE
jgi:hypothetical protein